MKRPATPIAAELDPVSRVTARMCVIGVGVVSVSLAIALSLTRSGLEQISMPWVAVAAVLVLVASYIYFIRAADPFGPLVSLARFEIFLGGVTLASVLNSLSQFGSNTLIRDDWGAVCLGLALIMGAPYRRPAEIVWFMLQAVAVTFTLTVLQVLSSSTTSALGTPSALIVLALSAATPAIAIGLGSAAYARSLIESLLQERREVLIDKSRHDAKVLAMLAETDAMGELGSLRRDVVPFLARLERTQTMQLGDAGRAAELASVLRRAIVERLSRGSLADIVSRYVDDDQVAGHLDERQSASLRALIGAITEQYGPSANIGLSLRRVDTGAQGAIEFALPSGVAVSSALTPFVRMVRLVFDQVDVRSDGTAATVVFVFESRAEQAAVSWEM